MMMPKYLENRLFVSVMLVLVWLGLIQINWFFLDREVLAQYEAFPFFSNLSIMCLEINGFLAAMVLVEILALIIPRLRKWRSSGFIGRQKLTRLALFLVVLGIIPSTMMLSNEFLDWSGSDPELLRVSSMHVLNLSIWATGLAATFLLLWTMGINTRKGFGHGISLFFLIVGLIELFDSVGTTLPGQPILTREQLLISCAVLVALAGGIWFVENLRPKAAEGKAFIPVRYTSAGGHPAFGAAAIGGVYRFFYHNGNYSFTADPLVVVLVALFLLYILETFLFYRPSKLRQLAPDATVGQIIGRLFKSVLFGFCFLAALQTSPMWLGWVTPLNFDPLTLMLVTVVIMDLFKEGRALLKNDLKPCFGFNDVATIEVARKVLEEAEIPHVFRSFHHRCLVYFFGPWLQVSLLVPPEHHEAVKVLFAQRFDDVDNQWLYPIPQQGVPTA